MESSDKLNEFFANGTEFTLHRLLSDIGCNDTNIDMNDLVKFDPMKLLDARSFNEIFQCDSFEEVNTPIDIQSDLPDSIPPSAMTCSSGSFSELCPPPLDLPAKQELSIENNQLKIEAENSLEYTELNSFDNFVLTPSTSAHMSQEFNFDESALAAIEQDYSYLAKQTTVVNTPSPSPTISKRPVACESRRISSRLQSRATLIDFKQILEDESCSSPSMSPNSSISIKRTKRSRHINRATDIKTEDDLSYYLERRRKNNEASKMSRAARKQKFGNMDTQCADYERVNAELRLKISTLEVVTANLKDGLIHTFQRKRGVDAKL
ncbi:unnamed protein product [Adineta ricciae]|uniref:BZIP domain-containing protein n=1 Tax=Adineta ricciae TaxID=249248 RepID=A0A814HFL1_ADIRI|nr:unnamed protein product [Adineta ricciae]CAF1009108.1 unnamed protein product [Adineta ricciae]